MYPYEKIDLEDIPINIFGEVKEILSTGWKKDSFPVVDLQNDQMPWQLSCENELRSWNFSIQCWKMLAPFFYAHSLSGDNYYLAVPIRIINDWINRSSDQTHPVSPMVWYGMAVGMRTYRLAYALDAGLQAGMLDKELEKKFWNSLLRHAEWLADDRNILFHTNHGYYQAAGQMAMGRRFLSKHPLMLQATEQSHERLRLMLTQQFTREGGHKEHSPGYHYMVYHTFKEILDSGLLNDSEFRAKAIDMEKALSWLVLPDRHLVNFGDTDSNNISLPVHMAEKKYFSQEMLYWTTNGKIGFLPDEKSFCFKETGYWIAREQKDGLWSYLAMQAAFHSRTHKHADDLTIFWYDQNCPILIDAGRYGYHGKTKPGSALFEAGFWYPSPWRVYCESTRAHNTLEFDKKDFSRRGVRPYGSALRECGEDKGIYYASAQCVHFKSIRRIRILFFMPRNWLIVVDSFFDRANHAHDVRQWFHLAENLEILPLEKQYRILLPQGKKLLCSPLLEPQSPSRIYKGEKEPRIQGWWSPQPSTIIPAPTFNFAINASDTGVFATIFAFSENLQPDFIWNRVNISCGKGRLRWLDDFGRHELRFERAEGKFDLDYNLS